MRPRIILLFLIMASVAVGCGGSPKSDDPTQLVLSLQPDGNLTGSLTQTGGSYLAEPNAVIKVGDDDSNNSVRGYVRFNLSSIPANASVQAASITLQQEAVVGLPYAFLGGTVTVDHVELGLALESSDWSGNSLALSIAALSNDTVLEPKTISVAQQIAVDLANGRQTSDFRLYFSTPTNSNTTVDQAQFTEQGQILEPRLDITVLVP